MAVGKETREALLAEAEEWACFWGRSLVNDREADRQAFSVHALRYLNAADLEHDEMRKKGDELARLAGLPPLRWVGDHPQTRVEYRGFSAEIDVEIAPFILELWTADIWTSSSCQDSGEEPGRVSVAIDEAADAARFLSIASGEYSEETESLYNRIVAAHEPEDWERFRRDRVWHFYADAFDIHGSDKSPIEDPWAARMIDFAITVTFPRSDLDEVVAQLRRYNRAVM